MRPGSGGWAGRHAWHGFDFASESSRPIVSQYLTVDGGNPATIYPKSAARE